MSERALVWKFLLARWNRPLLHFLLLGALVLGIRHAAAEPEPELPTRTIHVSEAIRSEVRQELEVTLGRRASDVEYDQALTRWKLDEVAYREALRLGLDDGDPVIRRQLITKYLEVSLKLQPLPEPTKAELDAWLAAHRDEYVPKRRYDFEHVFARGSEPEAKERARDFVVALEGGEQPSALGDRFHFGRTFLGRARESIEVEFGADFAARLVELPTGKWRSLRSKHGFHAVRVNRRSGGRMPDKAALERVLARDFREAARGRLFEEELEALKRSYRFVEQGP